MTNNKAEAANIKPPERPNKPAGPRREPKPPRKITADYLHNAGLYYLQRFAASSKHFHRVMTRKIDRSCQFHKDQDRVACIALLDALVEKFQRAGLLNDESFLRGSIISLRRRGLSGRAIEAKLAAKGIKQSDIKAGLLANEEETGTADADLTAALRLAHKKRLGPFIRPDAEMLPEKAMATLARAGFDYETARKALHTPLEEAEELLGL